VIADSINRYSQYFQILLMVAFWRSLGTWVVAGLLVSGCTVTAMNPQTEEVEALRIMPLGDSITDGFNVPGGYRNFLLPALEQRGYRITFVGSRRNGLPELIDQHHEGHSGWQIGELHFRVKGWLADAQPDVVLLLIGTNDVLRNDAVDRAPQRLENLIASVVQQSPRAVVLVATLPPIVHPQINRRVQDFNRQVPAIVQRQQQQGRAVHLVDLYPALTTADLADGVHPNVRGHQKMAIAWETALVKILPPPTPSLPPKNGGV
jgi:lysophospholipase L1-like esterase